MAINFYICDTETNGTDHKKHEISEVSFIKCETKQQLTKLIKIEHPEWTTPQALEVTGRTYKDLLVGEPKASAVEACHKFLTSDGSTPEHRCIIGHNIIAFDKRFLHALWDSVGKTFPANLWLDTQKLAKLWAKKLGLVKPSLTLTSSLQFTGLKPIDAGVHNAVSDSRNTYLLYKKGMEEGLDYLECMKRIPHI